MPTYYLPIAPRQQFNRLTIIEQTQRRQNGSIVWIVLCQCGTFSTATSANLRKGTKKSCGCLMGERYANLKTINKTHGLSHTPEHQIYKDIRRRCDNPKHRHYKSYGGRGITCSWSTVEDFISDMGPRPFPKATVERKDNDGPYTKENCIWATMKEQANNRRDNARFTFNGETRTIAQWAEVLGISPEAMQYRFRHWSVERALSEPIRPYHWAHQLTN